MAIEPSELILNKDGSIYHLNLLPEDISTTIITVGDPDRVKTISKYFDTIELTKSNREFLTQTGMLSGKRITVISTGIGTDNIDIVLNELDALVNIDLESSIAKSELTQLNFIRIGTSGTIRTEIPLNSFVVSEYALGFDGVMHFYRDHRDAMSDFIHTLIKECDSSIYKKFQPYFVEADKNLVDEFIKPDYFKGVTATNSGFYGPQGRVLRLALSDNKLIENLRAFNYNGLKVLNLEMETAGIYGFSKLLGHKAVSLNAILANRSNGKFSKNPEETVDKLIKQTLETIVHSSLF